MTTTTYLWDTLSDNILSEDDGSTQTAYTNEPSEFGNLVSQRRDINTNFYHFDARGDTRELSDDAETVTDTRLYDAWGNVLSSTGTTPVPFQFIGAMGYFFDTELTLTYVRARWNGSNEARWLTADPLGLADSSNVYQFVSNEPNSRMDPSGLLTVSPILKLNLGDAKCGDDVGIAWRFSFPNGAPCTGYLFQRVFVFCNSAKCGRDGRRQQKAYVESWPVTKGQNDVDNLSGPMNARWTDAAIWMGADNDTYGTYFQSGTVRLFCETGHPDNTNVPRQQTVGKSEFRRMRRSIVQILRGPCGTSSGNLRGTSVGRLGVPRFWNRYYQAEGSGYRFFAVTWRCCCDGSMVQSWAHPSEGASEVGNLQDLVGEASMPF